MARARTSRSHCPINFALELLGDPWSLLILRDVMLKGKRRFREFLKSEEAIASNILAERLKRLVAGGVLAKKGVPGIYLPTEKGLALISVLLELSAWGAVYDRQTAAPPQFLKAFRGDRGQLLREARAAAETGRAWSPG